ncbi:MAG: hypothetical protein RSE34_00030 [Brevundimonas sp.]
MTIPIGGSFPRCEIPAVQKVRAGELPVDVEEILIDLRVDDPEDDADTVERMARAACAFIERRTCYTLLPTEYEITLDTFALNSWKIDRGPLRQIDAIEFQKDRDVWEAVDPELYWTTAGARDFTLRMLSAFKAPTLWQNEACVRLRFSTGFDSFTESGGDLPIEDGLRTVLLMVTGHYYKNRELLGAADAKYGLQAVELGATSLLGSYRQFF